MEKLELREVQLTELEMLKVFADLCEKNDLYYTLSGGTLLGAIRHQGFIPWDDDIDVMMPRKDFERLLSLQDIDISMLPDHMHLTSWKTDEGSGFPFIKMIDLNTKVEDQYSNADQHLWIDIFPMDGCPDDDIELEQFFKKVLRFRRIILLKNAKMGEGKSLFKKILKPIAKLLLLPFSSRYLCTKYDLLAQSYDLGESDYIAGVTWGYGPQERISKEKFLTPIRVKFEGQDFNAPSNYDEYLTGLYHDYMQMPPEHQRHSRHEVKVYRKEPE